MKKQIILLYNLLMLALAAFGQGEMGNAKICEGERIALSAEQIGTYQWSTGETTRSILVSSEGMYSVTVTEAGCVYESSIEVEVIKPGKIEITQEESCGYPVQLNARFIDASGNSQDIPLEWRTDDGQIENSQDIPITSVLALQKGRYYVSATHDEVCKVEEYVEVEATSSLSIADIETYFKSNNFITIPIHIVDEEGFRRSQSRNSNSTVFATMIAGDIPFDISATINDFSQEESCLGGLSTFISTNEDICDDFLTTTQTAFDAADTSLWAHIFKGENGEDLLFIKGKQTGSSTSTIDMKQQCVNNALTLVENHLSNPPSAYGFDSQNKGEQLLYIVHQLLLEPIFIDDCPIDIGDVDDTNPILYKECKPKDYRFKTQGKLFKSGAKIWFCPTSLPDTIWVTDLNGNPITYPISWENATPILTDTINYSAIIDSSNYLSEGAVATFTVEGDTKETTLRLNNKGNASFELINDSISTYAYDDNQIMDYPSYKTTPKDGIPWKFLETTTTESMEAKLDKYPSASIQTSDPELTITPNSMSGKSQMVQLQHAATLSGVTKEIDVMGCDELTKLKVLVGDAIHKTVNFVYMCDSLGSCPPDIDITRFVKEANEVLNQAGLYISVKEVLRDTFTVKKTITIKDTMIVKDTFEIVGGDTIMVKDTMIVQDTIVVRDRLTENFAVIQSRKTLSRSSQTY